METKPRTGSERQEGGCPLHSNVERDFARGEKRMERLELKVDELLEGQTKNVIAVQQLQDLLSNGIRGDVRRAAECVERVEALCVTYENRLTSLEKFSWFRDSVTKLRDNFIENIIKLVALAAIIYVVTHWGDLIIKKVWG